MSILKQSIAPLNNSRQGAAPRGPFYFWALDLRNLATPVDHDRAFEVHHDFAILIEAGGFEAHDAHVRPRLRQPHFEHFTLGVDRIAVEDGTRQAV